MRAKPACRECDKQPVHDLLCSYSGKVGNMPRLAHFVNLIIKLANSNMQRIEEHAFRTRVA